MTEIKLFYLANARLPTEKAHGYQIVKMCEAFTQNGARVLLLHPFRHQSEPHLQEQGIFDYYGVPQVFAVRTLRNFDVFFVERFFRESTFMPIFFAHALLWALYATLEARKEKADVYYTRDSGIAFWLVRLGLATIYEAHAVPKRGQRWLLQRIARSPALKLVVALTSFIREGLMTMGFSEQNMIVLPDAVDLTMFDNLPPKEQCRRRLGLPLDRIIIGYIGRFRTMEMEKGIPELVEAMAQLPSFGSVEPLLMCVGGPMEVVPTYLEIARSCGVPEHRLQFQDRVPNSEVPFWIRACDVVTIPWTWTEFSAYFTSPLKLFEYMAAGVPIVATDLPSLREVLRHGENAWLVEPGSPKALATGIEYLLAERRVSRQLATNAQIQVRAHSWRSRCDTIIETFR